MRVPAAEETLHMFSTWKVHNLLVMQKLKERQILFFNDIAPSCCTNYKCCLSTYSHLESTAIMVCKIINQLLNVFQQGGPSLLFWVQIFTFLSINAASSYVSTHRYSQHHGLFTDILTHTHTYTHLLKCNTGCSS